MNLAHRFVDTKYAGDWAIKDGQLYKGNTLINNNFDLVDEIGKDTDGTITIFQNDTRITTNVEVDGKRAVGTKVSEEVAERVLNHQETYFGEANVAGNTYQAAYRPLMNKQHQVVGIFYVGAGQQMIDHIVAKIIKTIFIVLICIVIFAIIIIALFTKRIKDRLLNVTKVLKAAGDGDFTLTLKDKSKETGQTFEHIVDSITIANEGIQELSAISEEMSASMQEINASIENIAHLANVTSNDASQISTVTSEQLDLTKQMKQAVQTMTTKSDDLNDIVKLFLYRLFFIWEYLLFIQNIINN